MPIRRRDGVVQRYWTGKRPVIHMPRFYQPQYYQTRNIDLNIPRKLVTRGFVIAAIQVVPMGRELYIGYTTARLVYSSWNIIYDAYKNQDSLKQQAYDFARNEVKTGFTSYQTGLIWDHVKDNIPEQFRNETCNQLTNIVSNITEEEISLVEHALSAF